MMTIKGYLKKAQFYMKLKEKFNIKKGLKIFTEVKEYYKLKDKNKINEDIKNLLESVCRHRFTAALNNKTIKRKPCIYCGKRKTHGHHRDYKKPFKVIWVCAKHHGALHAVDRFLDRLLATL